MSVGAQEYSGECQDNLSRCQESLEKSQTIFSAFFEHAADGMAILDEAGSILNANPALQAMMGCDLQTLSRLDGKTIFLPQEGESICPLQTAQSNHPSPAYVEKKLCTPGGKTLWVRLYVAPLSFGDAAPARFIVLAEDITAKKQSDELLQASEERYRQLVENAGDIFYTFDSSGRITSLSPSFEATLGWPISEWIGNEFRNLIHPDDISLTQDPTKSLLDGEPKPNISLRVKTRSGDYRVLEFNLTPLMSEGQVVGSQGVARDVTSRDQAEKSLLIRTGQLEVLRQISLELAAELDLSTLLHSIVTRAVELLDASDGGFALYDAWHDCLEVKVATKDFMLPSGTVFQRGEGVTGRALKTGQPQMIIDYNRWKGRVTAMPGKRATVLAVPVRWGSEILGVITIRTFEPRRLTSADTELLELFAAHAAIAVENARLFQKQQEQRSLALALQDTAAALSETLMLDEVLDRILASAGQLVPHDSMNIMMVDGDFAGVTRCQGYAERGKEEYITSYQIRIDDYYTLRTMCVTGQPMVVPNTLEDKNWIFDPNLDWERSYIGSPIRSKGETLGFLALASEQPGFFTQHHADGLRAFADQAGIAIENARLFEKTRKNASRMALLAELSTTINQPQEIKLVLDAAIDGLTRVLNVSQIGIALLDDDRSSLKMIAGLTPSGDRAVRNNIMRVKQDLVMQYILASRTPFTVEDVQNDPRFKDTQQAILKKRVKSILAVPLIAQDEVIGVIGLDVLDTPRIFTEEEIGLAQTVANLVAVRLIQAQLLEKARSAAGELNIASEILHGLNAHPSFEDTLPGMAVGLKGLTGCGWVSLALRDESSGEERVYPLLGRPGDPQLEFADLAATGGQGPSKRLPLWVPDLANQPDGSTQAALYAAGYQAFAWLPLLPGEKMGGGLALAWSSRENYAQANLALIFQMAAALALAVGRSRLLKDARQRDTILEALAASNHDLLVSQNLDNTIPTLLERLGSALQTHRAFIFKLVKNGGEVPCLALRYEWSASGWSRKKTHQEISLPVDLPSLKRIFSGLVEGKTQFGITSDLPGVEKDLLLAYGARSVAVNPIRVGSTFWGCLAFEDRLRDRHWSTAEIETLKNSASSLGAAIARRRSENAEREQRRLAEALRDTASALNSTLKFDEVLDRILINIGQVVPHDAATIMLVEDGTARITREVGYSLRGMQDYIDNWCYPIDSLPNLVQMVNTGMPVIIPDIQAYSDWVHFVTVPWIRSYVGAPIRIKGQTIGFLNLDSNTPGFFSEIQASHLQAFADQAAVAIENARLFEEVHQRAREMDLLNQITHAAVSASDSLQMLQILADQLGELFGADSASIILSNQDSPAPSFTVASPANSRRRGLSNPLNQQETLMARQAVETGEAQVVEGDRSILALPLAAASRPLGAALVHFNRAYHFSPARQALAAQASAQIALAIAKMQTLEAERERTLQLSRANSLITALSQVAARVEKAPDPLRIMEILGAELKKLEVDCLVALRVPHQDSLSFSYLSLNSKLISTAEKLAGLNWHNICLTPKQYDFYQQVVIEKQPVFLDDVMPVLFKFVSKLPDALKKRIGRILTSGRKLRLIHLPLIAEERVIGVLFVWGEHLREADVPATSVFASQIAAALENARLYSEIQQLAMTDDLTALYNRRGLYELGRREVERALRFNRPLSALMFDLDHFKTINDTYGHPVGDEIMVALVARCRENVRDVDVFGRPGGDEFILLLVENDNQSAYQVAERLRRSVAETPMETSVGRLDMTISIGISTVGAEAADLQSLIEHADRSLYAAKQAGRNCTMTTGPAFHPPRIEKD